ncbi:MAG: hypothetical protein M3Q10_03150 [Chloroflexota bacterium]|nr:hypothetical protein [Chloroflexota bacterium]
MSRAANVPANPFATGDRGFVDLPTGRLVEIESRYRRWQDQIHADRRSWPPPETARLYVEAVLGELEAELAARAAGVAA